MRISRVPTHQPRKPLPPFRESQTAAYMRENWAALVEERDRLRFVINMIAESRIVSVIGAPTEHRVTWGCGICEGESAGYDKPDGRGVYAHKDWCPRK